MEIEAGKLRHRLSLLAPPNADDQRPDSFGQVPQGPVLVTQVWGSVEAVSGREFWQAQQAGVVISHRIVIRFTAVAIAKDWQIQARGRTFNVMVPPRDVDGRRRRVEIMCQEMG